MKCDNIANYRVKIVYRKKEEASGVIVKLDEFPNNFFVLTSKHTFDDTIVIDEVSILDNQNNIIPFKSFIVLSLDIVVFIFENVACSAIKSLDKIKIAQIEKDFGDAIFSGYPNNVDGAYCEKCDYHEEIKTEDNLYRILPKKNTDSYMAKGLKNSKGYSGSGLFIKSESTYELVGIIKEHESSKSAFHYIALAPLKDEIMSRLNSCIKSKVLQPEIKMNSLEILRLIVSRRDYLNLSEDKGTKNSKKSIHYEYYTYNDGNDEKGFLFLGNNIISKNVFLDLKSRIKKSNVKIEIFLVKEIKDNRIVDKINNPQGIKQRIKENNLVRTIKDILYIDDLVWTNTLIEEDKHIGHKRDDYIDQFIYNENNKNFDILSLDFFINEIESKDIPISVIYGDGGVGKTTFCDALEHTIDYKKEIRKKVFYIKGEKISDILINNQGVTSLEDLYILFKNETSFQIEKTDFNLNYMTGNIIVIIDAIEEIESKLGVNFDIKSFFKSLEELNKRFFSTKIIITTREPFYQKIKKLMESDGEIQYFQFLGFTQDNLKTFLTKKYNNNKKSIRAVENFIEDNKLFNSSNIIPLFVDWVCKIIDRPNEMKEMESEYFLKNINIDKLLIKLINREIEKQSLSMSVDDMFLLLSELIVEHKGSMAYSDFDEYINLQIGDSNVDRYIKNPLLKKENNTIKIKYDILESIIKSRFLRYKILNNQRAISLLKSCSNGNSELFNSTRILFNEKNIINNFKYQINFLTKLLKKDDFKNIIEKQNIKKSISAILHFSKVVVEKDESSNYTQLLTELYNTQNTISNLYIYGELYPLNFKGIQIRDAEFNDYEDFINCVFPSDNSPIFYYTKFVNINIPNSNKINSNMFDSSCQYDNSNIEEVIKITDNKINKKKNDIYKDIVSICKKIDTSAKLLKVFINENTIKSVKPNKVLNFIAKLIEIELLIEDKKKNEKIYRINHKYYDELPDIKLNDFTEELKEKINSIFDL